MVCSCVSVWVYVCLCACVCVGGAGVCMWECVRADKCVVRVGVFVLVCVYGCACVYVDMCLGLCGGSGVTLCGYVWLWYV